MASRGDNPGIFARYCSSLCLEESQTQNIYPLVWRLSMKVMTYRLPELCNEMNTPIDRSYVHNEDGAIGIVAFRKSRRESQSRFWARFGVTQSRGSRFECGAEIPTPVCILLGLYINQSISDCDLGRAARAAEGNGTVRFINSND
jgi:hypothetical protein